MTTNLNIPFWQNLTATSKNLTLEAVPGSDNKSVLKISLSGGLEVWDNVRNEKNTNFPVNENPADNKDLAHLNLWWIKITGPTKILTTFRNLINLKAELNKVNYENIQLVINKDLSNQNDHWVFTEETGADAGKWTLQLSEADFGGVLDETKISINQVNYKDTEIETITDYEPEKQALLHLEDLFRQYETKYGNPANLDFDKGPDIIFLDPQNDLGKSPKPTVFPPRTVSGLWTYFYGDKGDISIEKEEGNIKHLLFDIYQDKINFWMDHFITIKKLLKIKINTKYKTRILAEMGYNPTDEEELKKEPGLYKGFPLLDPNLKVVPDPDNDNELQVEKVNPNQIVRYIKKNIDAFRVLDTNHTVFNERQTIQDGKGNDIEVFVKNDPKKMFGFQPGDVLYNNTKRYHVTSNGNWIFAQKSKIFYDIFAAQNVEEAMDLAFFGKDYQFAQSDFDEAHRQDRPRDGWVKTPNLNLKFNEVEGWNRSDTLKHYLGAFSGTTGDGDICCQWRTPGDATGTGATDALKWDDPDTRNKIEANHQLAQDWIKDYEAWEALTFANLNETELNKIKTRLEWWKGERIYQPEGAWVEVIDNLLAAVEAALHHTSFEAEVLGLRTRGTSLAQKIYHKCQPGQDGFTEEVFLELKKLVSLLDEAFGTKTPNTETNLKQFIEASKSNPDQEKALKIAKLVKNQDSDPEQNCVETAFQKLATPDENKLEAARSQLRDLLAGLKVGEEDAYAIVSATIQDSETDLNQASLILEKLNEIDSANQDNDSELLNALNNLKNETTNTAAWTALNQYIRAGQTIGYADEMLKKLTDWAQHRRQSHEVIKNAKSKSEFQLAKTEFMKKSEYRQEQTAYDQIYFPLLAKAAEIRENETSASPEEKELASSMAVIVSDYSDWKNQLADLETKLKKLKDFAEGGTKHNVISSYSSTEKTALKKLIEKMETKAQEWRVLKANSEQNNPASQNPLPWYQTTAGIIGIIVLTLALVAGVVYYYWGVNQAAPAEEAD